MDFYFQILERGKFSFLFSNGVVSTLDEIRQDLDEIKWADLLLDENGQPIQAITGQTDFSDSVKLNSGKFSLPANPGVMLLIAGAILSAGFLVFLIKKQEKKRPLQSVNFK